MKKLWQRVPAFVRVIVMFAAVPALGMFAFITALRACYDVSTHVSVGDQATVPQDEFVTDARSDAPGLDSDCRILQGRTVTVVAIQESRVLLRYHQEGDLQRYECVDGTMFMSWKSTFSSMNDDYQRTLKVQEDERKLKERARQGN